MTRRFGRYKPGSTPGLASAAAVLMSDNPTHPPQVKAIQDTLRGFGLTVLPTMVRSSDDFDAAFKSMAKQKAEALVVLGGPPFSSRAQRDKLRELAAKAAIPTEVPPDPETR